MGTPGIAHLNGCAQCFGYVFLKVRLIARCDAEGRMRTKRNPA